MRIVLVQPDDDEALALVESFHDMGYDVCLATSDPSAAIEYATESKPRALLVCLDILAEASLETCASLADQRAFRNVPLLFAGGAAPALQRAQERYPRASFTRMEQLHTAIASLRSQ